MSAILTAPSTKELCGVPVDERGQPLKAWKWPVDLDDDYQRGAFEAWNGRSRVSSKHSKSYNEGRAAQLALLPKKEGKSRAIQWGRCKSGVWRMGSNW
jgi:hypothetical protein